MPKTTVTKTKTTDDLENDIRKILQPLGGIENFIKPGEKVLLKPNFNTADPFPASSALDFLEAAINLVKKANPSKIFLGDSCTLTQKTEEVMEKLDVFELGQRLGVEIQNFDKGKYIKKEIAGQYLKTIKIPRIFEEVDKLILLPCLKTHKLGRFTMSLKLGVGIMKKTERIRLHVTGHLEEKIAEINLAFMPDLIILDGRKAFVTEGPTEGKLVEPKILLAGTDRIAVDVEALKILKSYPAKNKLDGDPWQLPQIKRAVELDLGVKNEQEYQITDV